MTAADAAITLVSLLVSPLVLSSPISDRDTELAVLVRAASPARNRGRGADDLALSVDDVTLARRRITHCSI